MESTLLLLVLLPFCAVGINIKNNACHSFGMYHLAAISSQCYYNPDILSTVPKMAERHDYNEETHSTTTDDGYILNVFRITSKNQKPTKSPVFVQHGIATNSGPWVDIGNRSIAFRLADEGYDVWLGNVRGSTYSNKHETLNVNTPKYWDFNLDTIAQKDITAQLQLVANQTGNAGDIIYIGHSMGTTLGFMHASENPGKEQGLIKGLIAFAPVVYLDGVAILELATPIGIPLLDILGLLQIKGLLYQEELIHRFLTGFCKNVSPGACLLLINVAFGRTVQFQAEDLLLYYSYWPSGISIYQLKQYLQIVRSKRFQKYDYGLTKNNRVYGQRKPPTYDLSKIDIPVRLFYGKSDSLYKQKNVDRLFDEIGSDNKEKYSTPSDVSGEDFDHIDFMYSKNMEENLYKKLFEVLDSDFGENSGSES
ncbi:lipase 1-like [Tenebrio molitor]|uniref:lipase 1-like n=1 Tax=Tenebrio molitor TaxID=7067 RepID=UPI0036247934